MKSVVNELKRLATKKTLDGMARYGIPSERAFGVAVGTLQKVAKKLGKDHELAEELWKTGWYEARMLACFVDEPKQLTPAQMERWCRDFDSWAICDTACFHLFDKSPHAMGMIKEWCGRRAEFEKRAAFALLASLAVHDKTAADEVFVRCLPLIERGAGDQRNFVKKGVSWALRAIGRRSPALRSVALALAKRLAASNEAGERWVGRDALRDLTR